MMLGWYRKAVKRLGHEPISFEQLTTPGARGHEKPVIGVSLRGSAKMGKALIDDVRHRRGSFVSNFAEGGGFLKTDASLARPEIQLHSFKEPQ